MLNSRRKSGDSQFCEIWRLAKQHLNLAVRAMPDRQSARKSGDFVFPGRLHDWYLAFEVPRKTSFEDLPVAGNRQILAAIQCFADLFKVISEKPFRVVNNRVFLFSCMFCLGEKPRHHTNPVFFN